MEVAGISVQRWNTHLLSREAEHLVYVFEGKYCETNSVSTAHRQSPWCISSLCLRRTREDVQVWNLPRSWKYLLLSDEELHPIQDTR